MQLASVRALKEQLQASRSAFIDERRKSATIRSLAATTSSTHLPVSSIALGIVPGRADRYRLAVRTRAIDANIQLWTEHILREARGEVDIRHTGPIVKRAKATVKIPNARRATFYQRRLRPLRIGSSISDVQSQFVSAGTLGCFVTQRRPPHYLGVLTNNHVIANENRGAIKDPIVQPGTLDDQQSTREPIGQLGKMVRLTAHSINSFDLAIGHLYDHVPIDPRRLGTLGILRPVKDPWDLPPRATVYKVGRTTGQTRGRITAYELDNVLVEYDMGTLRFDNQMEIEGAGRSPFSNSGDSGSLIVDEHGHAIGLLFAGSEAGGTNGHGLTFAHPLHRVLEHLDVELER